MEQRGDWSPRKRCKIVLYSKQGCIYEDIGRQVGGNLTKDSISKYLKRYKETCLLENQAGEGRKRCTTANDDRQIARLSLLDRRILFGRIQDEMVQSNVK